MATSSASKLSTIKVLLFVGVACTLVAASLIGDVISRTDSLGSLLAAAGGALICFGLAYLVFVDLKKFRIIEARVVAEQKAAEQTRQDAIDAIRSKIRELEKQSGFKAIACTYLGGTGTRWSSNEPALLTYGQGKLGIINPKSGHQEYLELDHATTIEVSGPGTQTTSAGVAGGGFGLEGFVTGVAVATAINAITTKSNTNTFLRVLAGTYEVYFHTADMEPTGLRLALSPAIVYIESKKREQNSAAARPSIADEFEKLEKLRESGVLRDEEFTAAKAKLLAM